MDTVYIETSIVSHASARPSSNISVAALQHQAREWWAVERPKFNLVTSQLTIVESSDSDPSAAADRLKMLDGLPLVTLGPDVDALANLILSKHLMPQKSSADAVHVAAVAIAGVNYLLTQKLQAHCERSGTSACLSPIGRPRVRPTSDLHADGILRWR